MSLLKFLDLVSAGFTYLSFRKGTEVNISYGEYFYVKERGRRQKHLKESYYFYPCGCEACSNDWPLMSELHLVTEKYKCPFCDQSFIADSLEEVGDGKCPTCDRSMAPSVAEFTKLKQRAEMALAEVSAEKKVGRFFILFDSQYLRVIKI